MPRSSKSIKSNLKRFPDGDVVNKIEARPQGIELEARGQITEQWDISVGYSYLDAEDKETGKSQMMCLIICSHFGVHQLDDNWRWGVAAAKLVGDRYAGNDEAVALVVHHRWFDGSVHHEVVTKSKRTHNVLVKTLF